MTFLDNDEEAMKAGTHLSTASHHGECTGILSLVSNSQPVSREKSPTKHLSQWCHASKDLSSVVSQPGSTSRPDAGDVSRRAHVQGQAVAKGKEAVRNGRLTHITLSRPPFHRKPTDEP